MIVSSSMACLTRKADPHNFNNLLLRSDGFQHLYKGLTYKHNVNKNAQNTHVGTYTSLGKRTPAK